MIPISIPWYETEDDFKAVLLLVPSSESAGAMKHSDWQASVERREKEFQEAGQMTFRVNIKPSAIKAWCEERGRIVCRDSIREYATIQMATPMLDRSNN